MEERGVHRGCPGQSIELGSQTPWHTSKLIGGWRFILDKGKQSNEEGGKHKPTV